MTAYVIVDIEVIDPEGYKEYVNLAPEAVKLYDGKYIARGGQNETLEGDWQAKRLVLLEFPSVEHAKKLAEFFRIRSSTRTMSSICAVEHDCC